MTVREAIQRLRSAPPDSEIMIKNPDGTFRPVTLVYFHHEDGAETEIIPAERNEKGEAVIRITHFPDGKLIPR